jgi:hypothetical protein
MLYEIWGELNIDDSRAIVVLALPKCFVVLGFVKSIGFGRCYRFGRCHRLLWRASQKQEAPNTIPTEGISK